MTTHQYLSQGTTPYSEQLLGSKTARDLIRWFLRSRAKRLFAAVKRATGFTLEDITQEVCWRLLAGKKPEPHLAMSTVICNSTRWVCLRLLEKSKRSVTPTVSSRALSRLLVRTDDEPYATTTEIRQCYQRLLATVTYKQRIVLEMRYGLGDGHYYTLAETARVIGVTRERIRQIECNGIRKLQAQDRMRVLLKLIDPLLLRRCSGIWPFRSYLFDLSYTSMDPQVCLQRIIDAYNATKSLPPANPQYAYFQSEITNAFEDLAAWLYKGGFPPTAVGPIFGEGPRAVGYPGMSLDSLPRYESHVILHLRNDSSVRFQYAIMATDAAITLADLPHLRWVFVSYDHAGNETRRWLFNKGADHQRQEGIQEGPALEV